MFILHSPLDPNALLLMGGILLHVIRHLGTAAR
jgi:hypothetical protein